MRSVKYIRLPICDLVFCIFSLSLHIVSLCSIVFAAFQFKNVDYWIGLYFLVSTIFLAILSASVVSFIWYLKNTNGAFQRIDLGLHVTVHILQLTLLWRHYVFFRRIPEHVAKFLFCELLILRLLHSAIFALPCCLFLLFTLFQFRDFSEIENALLTGATLTLADFCFSLASFSRRTKRDRPEILILSWPSILCKFAWRLGTVGARVVILAAYASAFYGLTGIVVGLHLVLMILGLFMFTRPERDPEHGRGNAIRHWIAQCAWLSAVYSFCFYNPTKKGVKWRSVAFYSVMLLENSMLLITWLFLSKTPDDWTRSFILGVGWGGFAFGIAMMAVYYKYLHVTKLKEAFNEKSSPSKQAADEAHQPHMVGSPGTFICKLPILLPIRSRRRDKMLVTAKDQTLPPSKISWPLNGRRCRSVPNTQRRRGATALANSSRTTVTTDFIQAEQVLSKQGSRSLPRRLKDAHRKIAGRSSLPAEGGMSSNVRRSDQTSPMERIKDTVTPSRSTFIETIF